MFRVANTAHQGNIVIVMIKHSNGSSSSSTKVVQSFPLSSGRQSERRFISCESLFSFSACSLRNFSGRTYSGYPTLVWGINQALFGNTTRTSFTVYIQDHTANIRQEVALESSGAVWPINGEIWHDDKPHPERALSAFFNEDLQPRSYIHRYLPFMFTA